MSKLERKKQYEEEVRIAIELWPKAKQKIAYEYLRNGCGCTMDGIHSAIEKDLEREEKKNSF